MKNFLVTTSIKESCSPKSKNIFLGSWCFNNENKTKKKKIINYHWSNKKKFQKDALYIDKTTEKFCKFLTKRLPEAKPACKR